ncbi:MAG: universal stress protein [Pseudomonadota bacterium]
MPVRTVLVCLTTEANTPSLLSAAAAVARQGNAHVICLHTIEALEVYPGIAMHVTAPMAAQFQAVQQEQADAIKAMVDALAEREDFVVEWRLLKARSVSAADRMLETAYGVDLVIMAQEARGQDRPDQKGVQEAVIRNSGRPVLVIPQGYQADTIGHTLMIGWSPTPEAARAAHDALALAQSGAQAHILVAASGAEPGAATLDTAEEMAVGLERHGVTANLIPLALTGGSVAAALQDQAEQNGADVIVTGGFGHSWLYDFVIGAVTHELLSKMRLPVLFSK